MLRREHSSLLPLISEIKAYAEQEGCRCVRIFGRKGWGRVLDGYQQTHAIIDKHVDDVGRAAFLGALEPIGIEPQRADQDQKGADRSQFVRKFVAGLRE